MNGYEMKGPVIPENIVDFTRAIAERAKQLKIDNFTMSFHPRYNTECRGEIKISFSRTDARGRACNNLYIYMQSDLSHRIEYEPESSN